MGPYFWRTGRRRKGDRFLINRMKGARDCQPDAIVFRMGRLNAEEEGSVTTRTTRLSLVLLAVVALSACSASDDDSSVTSGTIGLAVSETCLDESDPQCVSVNGERVLSPSGFEQAGVQATAVTETDGQNAIEVTFDADGAEIFSALTERAADAGDTARLIVKFGDQIVAAVAVMEAVETDRMQLGLSPEEDAQDLIDLIDEG